MAPELRREAPAHATGAVVFVEIEEIAEDASFRLRPEGDVAGLAASIGRLGQLEPVELRPMPGAPEEGPRFQLLAGFRRLAALRLLLRERVLARIHPALADEDAWALALTRALTGEPLDGGALAALRDRLRGGGMAPWALDLLDDALVRAPVAPELRERFYEFLKGPLPPPAAGDEEPGPGGVEEVSPEDFARDLLRRMAEVSQDLATAREAWKDLPGEERTSILRQARYVADLVPYLERAER